MGSLQPGIPLPSLLPKEWLIITLLSKKISLESPATNNVKSPYMCQYLVQQPL
uniref:Uncharacterized protein n=1 Tax=Trichinella nativa TaxID=6335 RepID=A0A0V1KJ49_9BILA